jgi:uncharacterized repeat protein (TIGR01451 family)
VRLNRLGSGREFLKSRGLLGFVLLAAAGGVLLRMDSRTAQQGVTSAPASSVARSSAAPASTARQQQIQIAYSHLPLMFEVNQGQTDPKVKFLARGFGYGLFLTADEAVLKIQSSAKKAFALSMALDGANKNASVVGTDELPGKSNYFLGNDPKKWHRNVSQFARVRYQNVYPGIDVVYYGSQGRLEYDFEVAPGVDARQVNLRFRGPDRLHIDGGGNLLMATAIGDVVLQAPRIYQKIGEEQRSVAGKFVIRAKDQVGFELGDYDRSRTLVIDPKLAYSTYLGGSGPESCSAITGLEFVPGCPGIAVDTGINAYIAGATQSTDFPPQPGVLGSLDGTAADVFVAKFNSQASALIYSTYLGGSGTDYPAGIAVDAGFNVYVAGTTASTDFPTLNGLTPTLTAGNHVFVTKLDSGANLSYSTYLAGGGVDSASGVATDSMGKIYVSGTTTSTNFPTTANSYSTLNGFTPPGTIELFFSKLDPTKTALSSLVYSSYLGGTAVGTGETPTVLGGGVAVDTNCDAYVSAGTNYTDMPTANAYQGAISSGHLTGHDTNVWLAELMVPTNSNCGSDFSLNYATYFGGSGTDVAYGVSVDSSHNAYVTGSTTSSDIVLPATDVIPPFQSCPGIPNPPLPAVPPSPCPAVTLSDAFVAKFAQPITTGTTPGDVTLTYFSYLGGGLEDDGLAIVADTTGGARITGLTKSTDFPNTGNPSAWQSGSGGGTDAFYARIDTTTTSTSLTIPTSFSSYLGGSGTDIGTGVALDFQSNSYVTGETSSGNFPTLTPFQGGLQGPSDAFVTKLGPVVILPTTVVGSPSPVGVGNPVTFTYTITNKSPDPTSGVVFTDSLAVSNASFVSATGSPGSCGAVAVQSVSCGIGLLNDGETATVTVTLTPTVSGELPNSGYVSAPAIGTTSSTTVKVNDYSVGPTPGSLTTVQVPAGTPAQYSIQVTPTGAIPNTVTLSCGSNLPSLATCTWPNESNVINNLNNGPQIRVLAITSQARVTTTTQLRRNGGPFYALWFPVSGLALVGMGIGGKTSRRRKLLMGLVLVAFFALVLLQASCGTTASVTTTTGTPAGTYTIPVNAVSGSITRTTPITIVIQ